jgi:dipeptidase E
MSATRILALSSSRVGKSAYLETAVLVIKDFLGSSTLNIAFIPFASVNSYEEYLSMVRTGLQELNHNITLVEPSCAKETIEKSDVIMIGGGNTFKLLHDIYQNDLMELIRSKVHAGAPYVGWSAGANITGRTISTTNDMPIIEPESFAALNFFPFQINPHYLNKKREDHNGETRDQRLEEFIKLNPRIPVVGIPEGTALLQQNDELKFIGKEQGIVFLHEGSDKPIIRKPIEPGKILTHLLNGKAEYIFN